MDNAMVIPDLSEHMGCVAVLAEQLATRGDGRGIVNNVALARHKIMGAVEPAQLAAVMAFNMRPSL